MKKGRKSSLFFDMRHLASMMLDELTEDEIQEWYGSDYYVELKKYIKQDSGRMYLNDDLHD